MFSKRSTQKELMDDFSLNDEMLRKNLKELESTNHWLGSKKTLICALNFLYKRHTYYFNNNDLIIGDLGCGSGDLLKTIYRWGKSKRINSKLIGIDVNEFILSYAKNNLKQYPTIHFEQMNILSHDFKKSKYDIITLNSFCHHFTDSELIVLIEQLVEQNRLAIIINDLHRHVIPYITIKYLSKIFNFSYLAQHDGPLSVLRAFQKKDLLNILAKANVKSYIIRWVWPFRWQIIIDCHKKV